jgi:hypothetical protein
LPAVGIGLRWAVTRYLDAQLYWGQSLNNVQGSGELQAQGSQDLQDDGVQFCLRMQLPRRADQGAPLSYCATGASPT